MLYLSHFNPFQAPVFYFIKFQHNFFFNYCGVFHEICPIVDCGYVYEHTDGHAEIVNKSRYNTLVYPPAFHRSRPRRVYTSRTTCLRISMIERRNHAEITWHRFSSILVTKLTWNKLIYVCTILNFSTLFHSRKAEKAHADLWKFPDPLWRKSSQPPSSVRKNLVCGGVRYNIIMLNIFFPS